jgi:hypothetical protein
LASALHIGHGRRDLEEGLVPEAGSLPAPVFPAEMKWGVHRDARPFLFSRGRAGRGSAGDQPSELIICVT